MSPGRHVIEAEHALPVPPPDGVWNEPSPPPVDPSEPGFIPPPSVVVVMPPPSGPSTKGTVIGVELPQPTNAPPARAQIDDAFIRRKPLLIRHLANYNDIIFGGFARGTSK
jgi:hypothetical protein